MRTATPFATWCSSTERGPSATSGDISTPRLTGPGCITIESGFERSSRSGVRPNIRWYSPSDEKNGSPWRSSWIRSVITTSAPSIASSAVGATESVPALPSAIRSMPSGISVRGPANTTFAPSSVNRCAFDRATRLCRMSPTIATRNPSMRPLRSSIVRASSSACVGCSCAPSPALTTDARVLSATIRGAPGAL